MAEIVNIVVPKIVPSGVAVQAIPHEGKSDLESSLPRKLRAWREPGVSFVVMRDKDSGDCVKIKKHLLELCKDAGRADTLVRIVVHELENWYFGDLVAVATAFEQPGLELQSKKAKYRTPDRISNACQEFKKLVPDFQKVSGAKAIAPHLNITRNTSHSFKIFTSGVAKMFNP